MIDRLPDFRRLIEQRGICMEKPKDVITVQSEEMMAFTRLVHRGNLIINALNEEAGKLEGVKKQILTTVGEKEKVLKDEIDDSISKLSNYRKQGKEVADDMKRLATEHKEKKNLESVEANIPDYGVEEIRVVSNLNGSYLKNLEKALERSQVAESNIKHSLQEKLLRGVGVILGRDPTEEERKEYLESPEKYQLLLEDKLKQGQAHIQLQNKVRDLESRHKEILQLENVSKLENFKFLFF